MSSLLALLAACGARISDGASDVAGGNGDIDAGGGTTNDASGNPTPTADAGFGPWAKAVAIPQAATAAGEDDATLTSTGLEMVFAIDTGTNAGKDLYYTSRTSATSAWTAPSLLTISSSKQSDESPRFSPDDKTLYFASGRNNTNGTLDIYMTTRGAVGSTAFGNPTKLITASTPVTEKWYMPCGGDYLMVQDNGAGLNHFVGGKIGDLPLPITELSVATGSDTGTFLTADCLTIYFASTRATPTMIYTSHRDSTTAKWQTPTAVTDLQIAGGNGNEEDPWMSPDGRTFVFVSDISGSKDVYITTR
jgi:hypothetical protein